MTCRLSLVVPVLRNVVFGVAAFGISPRITSRRCSPTMGDDRLYASFSVRVLPVVTSQSNMSGLNTISDEESAADWKW